MELSSGPGRIALFVLTVVAVVAASPAIPHRGEGHKVAAAQSGPKQAVAGTVRQPDQPSARPSKTALNDETAFVSLAEAEVSQLREGVTLAQWMDLRGTNEGWQTSAEKAYFDCRTLVRTEALPSGRQITRTVYFYPPKAPTPAVFPTLVRRELIKHSCTLAMIRIQTRTPAEQDGHTFAQALKQLFVKKYGSGIGMEGTGFSGSGSWEDAARWMAGSEIVSAYDPEEPFYTSSDPEHPFGSGSVFVFARLPVADQIEQNACCARKAYRYRSLESTQFHRAILIAGVETAVSERIRKLYEVLFRASAFPEKAQQPEETKWRDSMVPLLRHWLNAVKTLAPTQRAAGLYAADRLLAAAGDVDGGVLGEEDNPELRSVLEKIGAGFEFDQLGKSYAYAGNWLKEARELNPDGAVGQMAVLVSLARGLPLQLRKDQDIFHTVIADGEWLLSKSPDAPTAAQVHFMVGDAYSDIVALAEGAEPDYGDPAEYRNEADSARKKALQHYRAGLAADGISENAKDAWLQAWHLSAGLLPTTRYVYIND